MRRKHEEWNKGEPCPECGSVKLVRELVYHDRVVSENGQIKEIDIDHNNVVKIKFTCEKCGTVLMDSPSE